MIVKLGIDTYHDTRFSFGFDTCIRYLFKSIDTFATVSILEIVSIPKKNRYFQRIDTRDAYNLGQIPGFPGFPENLGFLGSKPEPKRALVYVCTLLYNCRQLGRRGTVRYDRITTVPYGFG
jgi:hypothetical protein